MRHFDLVIIGAGSGNSILDHRFASWNVAIVEPRAFGGTCLNAGCVPTKMLVHVADVATTAATGQRLGIDTRVPVVRWAEVRDRIFGRLDPIAAAGREYRRTHPDNDNVTVFTAHARFVGPRTLAVGDEAITADRFVLACGGRPVIPDIPGLPHVDYHTSDTIMRLDALPRRLVILGGGVVAAEFAHVFSAFGVEVTVVSRAGRLVRQEDTTISDRFTELARERWDVRTQRKTIQVEPANGAVRLHLEGPHGAEVVEGDELLVAVGRSPNADLLDVAATGVTIGPRGHVIVDEYQRTVVDGVYALGDISSVHGLKHVANHEARVVTHNLLHPDTPIAADHRYVPHAVFTAPQIASVGLTQRRADDLGVRYVTSVQDYADVAYGWALEDTTGLAKLLADPDTGHLLGAHIIGPQASTLIQPIVQAMSFGLPASDMARGQYWIHPALPELVENALLKLPLNVSAVA